jgi:hypothetical protein
MESYKFFSFVILLSDFLIYKLNAVYISFSKIILQDIFVLAQIALIKYDDLIGKILSLET